MNEKLQDHIEGTIYGNCIGDAIGMMTEFLKKGVAHQVN
jgi:ADP-ribosylglycohydrolase